MATSVQVPAKRRAVKPQKQTAAQIATRKFFISYRRSEPESATLAQFLRQELAGAGHEIFIDVGMPVGTDWVAEISARIEWCDYLIVLLSDGARTSEMVQGEVRLAYQRRKRDGKPGILPIRVRYEGTLDYELDSYLGRIQYILWKTDSDSPVVLQRILERAGDANVVQADIAVAPLAAPPDLRRPQPRVDPRYINPPGGTISAEDPFYITRSADAAVMTAAASPIGMTTVIKGPRQTGKSSVLIRYMAEARRCGREVSFLDFAEFLDDDLAEYPRLLGMLADHFTQTLNVEPPSAPPLQQRQLTKFVEQNVLRHKQGTIALVFDEVDRLLGRPYQDDFFTMLRLWHNKRAELKGWERVSLALVLSTEPYLLISRDDRSPFNVSPPVALEMFTLDLCHQLNEKYGSPLKDPRLVEQLHEELRGQPYLTRLAFYRLTAAPPMKLEAMIAKAGEPDGPFGDHLRALLLKLSQHPELLDALSGLISNGTIPKREEADRLAGAGLIVRADDKLVPANRVYARFFKSVWS